MYIPDWVYLRYSRLYFFLKPIIRSFNTAYAILVILFVLIALPTIIVVGIVSLNSEEYQETVQYITEHSEEHIFAIR